MGRLSIQTRLRAFKIAIVAGPLLALLAVLKFVLPALKDRYDLARFGDEAQVIEEPHFRVYTKHEDGYARELARGIEEFYRAFLERFGRDFGLALGDEKAVVFVFREKEELEKYAQAVFHDPLTNNGGFYSPGKREIGIIAYGGNLEIDLSSAYHEAVHMAFDVGLGPGTDLPAWLSEGLAVYFGDTVSKNDGKIEWGSLGSGEILRVVGEGFQALKQENARTLLERTLRASSADFTSESNTVFYAMSFLLVHYLLDGEQGAWREGLFRYFRDSTRARGGGRGPNEFYRALGVESEGFALGWREYVFGLRLKNG